MTKNFSILMLENNRSKAYIQNLVKNNFIPKFAIVLDKNSINEQSNQTLIHEIDGFNCFYDEKESIITTLDKNNIAYKLLNTRDVNSELVEESIKNIDSKFIVYSGPSGAIVGKKILDLGKLFIHAHPGDLPKYRGSTTIYYSILIDYYIACSIIGLNSIIDTGDIYFKIFFNINSQKINLDTVMDPIVRAETLIEFLQNYDDLSSKKIIQTEENHAFYIIHPVLKHLSTLKYRNR